MCGRYVIVNLAKIVESEFNVELTGSEEIQPNANVGIGQYAPVITDEKPHQLQFFKFGLTPFWSKKATAFFNARAEGDHNQENNPQYNGAKGIILKPSFRKPIRSQRCLVLANAYIEGTTQNGLNEPFVVYLPDRSLFAFAGIWDQWKNPVNNEEIFSFSIITTVANELIQKLPHQRMPVILPKAYEKTWLSQKAPLSDITRLLEPFDAEKMNAYPISNLIKNPKNNTRDFLKPTGEHLQKKTEISIEKTLELHGMGQYKHRK